MTTNAARLRQTFEARTELVESLQRLYAKAEGRALTPGEAQEERSIKDQIHDHDLALERGLRVEENRSADADFLERLGMTNSRESADGYDWASRGSLPMSADEFRDLTSSNVGSALLPAEQGRKIVENVVRAARVAGLAQRFTTTAEAFTFPTITANPSAQVVPEGQTIPESDPTYDPVVANVVKTGIISQASLEAWTSSSPAIAESLDRQHRLAHARKWDSLVLTGTGTGEPQGIVGHTGVNVTSAAAAPSLDVMHDTIGLAESTGLDPDALVFAMPPAVWHAIEGEADNNGRYLLGDPRSATDRAVFGVPVVLTDALPTDGGAGTNEATIVLGDFSYLGLVVREDARIDVSEAPGFAQGLITLRSLFRMSSAVLAPEAFEVVDGLTLA